MLKAVHLQELVYDLVIHSCNVFSILCTHFSLIKNIVMGQNESFLKNYKEIKYKQLDGMAPSAGAVVIILTLVLCDKNCYIFSTRTKFQNGYLTMWRYTLCVIPYGEV